MKILAAEFKGQTQLREVRIVTYTAPEAFAEVALQSPSDFITNKRKQAWCY